jgi:DNA-binding NarL/FixJ family response regulator
VRLLSSREKSLLRYIASGFDNKNIAAELFISEQTVKNYVGRVYTKIGVHNRIKVMQLALANIRYLETE